MDLVQTASSFWLVISGLLPLGWLSLLHSLQLRVGLLIGHWPLPNRPHPMDLPDDFAQLHRVLLSAGFESLIVALPVVVWTGTALFFAKSLPPPIRLFPLATWLLAYVAVTLDPFGGVAWYLVD